LFNNLKTMAQKPSIPKGTRDFGPAEMVGRNYIFNTIKEVFRKFGYQCIETPSMENLSTLLGKYGEEGDKLLFRIQNSGEKAALAPEKGLRYDLTVPFARFVVQHQNEIAFPFKRYQIQPVWRADRPQKGRYREFYQCDVDVIGSKSLLSELELVQMVDEVFGRFGVRVCIKINNRKILAGLAEVSGQPERLVDITVAIDKIDKIGIDAVKAELFEKGLTPEAVALIEPVLTLTGTTAEKIARMRTLLAASETGCKGLDEVETLFGLIDKAGISQPVELDLSLARGLNYYTGAIFEVKALDWAIGSICGGGRYDDLTGIFGLPNTSGVGISFGADRIYDVLTGLNLFPKNAAAAAAVLFTNMGEAEVAYTIPVAAALRRAGIACEIYPDNTKLKKQFEYADRKGIPFLAIVGDQEVTDGTVTLKNLATGEQRSIAKDGLAQCLAETS
jgi:histidyl-tRNA synthetase